MEVTEFQKDIQTGKVTEGIFKNDFVKFLNMHFCDVSNDKDYQKTDIDITLPNGTFDIKSWSDYFAIDKKRRIVIEDYTNWNEEYGAISKGWFYKSEANFIAYVNKKTRLMILLRFDSFFKEKFLQLVDNGVIQRSYNKVSQDKNGNQWQSSFYIVPLEMIQGCFSYYHFSPYTNIIRQLPKVQYKLF